MMDTIFYIPLIVIGLYCIVITLFESTSRLTYYKIKRIYYFASIVWFIIVMNTYRDKIISFISESPFGIVKEVWAYVIVSTMFIICAVLLEGLVICPRAIGEFSFGNIKVTYQDKLEIEDFNKTVDKSIDLYKSLITLENKMMCAMRDYAEECFTSGVSPNNMYINFFKKYYTAEKLLFCDECLVDRIDQILAEKINKFSHGQILKICKRLRKNKHYIFKQGNKNYLVALIPAVFLDNGGELLFVLEDTLILREEYDILSNITKVFDLEIYYLLQK